jgi:hypothetical protein
LPGPHHRHDHHPARVAAVVALAVALVAPAAAQASTPRLVALPSAVARLTPEPPLGGGATSTSEGRPHRVEAVTRVRVSVDADGKAFALAAVQRLVVHDRGDYVFSIAAPVSAVSVASGSQSTPGLRDNAILWAGFNPGTRTLAARAVLRRSAASSLPLGIERHEATVTLVDRTETTGLALDADVRAAPLEAALRGLRRAVDDGRFPPSLGAELLSATKPVSLQVAAPLDVTGSVGRRAVHLRLGGDRPLRATVPARGRIDLTVTPVPFLPDVATGLSGRRVLELANRTLLSLARVRQYQAFLGNPDPGGRSETTYRYVSATRPRPTAAPETQTHGGGPLRTALWIAAALAAAALAVVAWARA